MSGDALVKKYSRALFDSTEANKTTETASGELQAIVKVFSQDDVKIFFKSPFNTIDTKTMVAKSTLEGKCSPEIFNFIILVVENDRIALLSLINDAYQAMVRAKGGETEGTLYVSSESTAEFKAQVESSISKSLNKKVRLRVQTEPALISGYRVSVGGWTLDDSAQFHLNKIKEDILKRGI